jgi:type VI secretion system secreted protein Hcp
MTFEDAVPSPKTCLQDFGTWPINRPREAYAMAHEGYLSLTGTKQGKLKGESPLTGWQEKIQFISFNYEIKSPRDVATGQASGKRQHSAITITKEWGAASPQLFQAIVKDEIFTEVLFEFVKTNPNGEKSVYYTIKLIGGSISDYKAYVGTAKLGESSDTYDLEDVSFTFEKIELVVKDEKTAGSDSWTGK